MGGSIPPIIFRLFIDKKKNFIIFIIIIIIINCTMQLLYIFFLLFNFDLLSANEINLFTTRHYESDNNLYKIFEKETGIKVNVISGKSKPLEKTSPSKISKFSLS